MPMKKASKKLKQPFKKKEKCTKIAYLKMGRGRVK